MDYSKWIGTDARKLPDGSQLTAIAKGETWCFASNAGLTT